MLTRVWSDAITSLKELKLDPLPFLILDLRKRSDLHKHLTIKNCYRRFHKTMLRCKKLKIVDFSFSFLDLRMQHCTARCSLICPASNCFEVPIPLRLSISFVQYAGKNNTEPFSYFAKRSRLVSITLFARRDPLIQNITDETWRKTNLRGNSYLHTIITKCFHLIPVSGAAITLSHTNYTKLLFSSLRQQTFSKLPLPLPGSVACKEKVFLFRKFYTRSRFEEHGNSKMTY